MFRIHLISLLTDCSNEIIDFIGRWRGRDGGWEGAGGRSSVPGELDAGAPPTGTLDGAFPPPAPHLLPPPPLPASHLCLPPPTISGHTSSRLEGSRGAAPESESEGKGRENRSGSHTQPGSRQLGGSTQGRGTEVVAVTLQRGALRRGERPHQEHHPMYNGVTAPTPAAGASRGALYPCLRRLGVQDCVRPEKTMPTAGGGRWWPRRSRRRPGRSGATEESS